MKRPRFDIELLRRLWSTSITDKDLSLLFGVTRGNLHRRAQKERWPIRRIARRSHIADIVAVARAGHDVAVGWLCEFCGRMRPASDHECRCLRSRSERTGVNPTSDTQLEGGRGRRFE